MEIKNKKATIRRQLGYTSDMANVVKIKSGVATQNADIVYHTTTSGYRPMTYVANIVVNTQEFQRNRRF